MAYCTATDVKTYLGIVNSTGDDTLLTSLISRAQKYIENRTGRVFESSTAPTTRRFTVGKDTDGMTLYLDEDLASVTTVTNNADGTPEVISSTEYTTLPRNRGPYYALKLLGTPNKSWTYANDPEMGITVAGRWGYSTSAPADIVQACVRLSAHMYRMKDAQVFDVTAIPEAGTITIPKGEPPDVRLVLDMYQKKVAVW